LNRTQVKRGRREVEGMRLDRFADGVWNFGLAYLNANSQQPTANSQQPTAKQPKKQQYYYLYSKNKKWRKNQQFQRELGIFYQLK
jgi:hypothetical protein